MGPFELGIVFAAIVVSAGLTFAVVKFLDRLRKVDIENLAKQVTEKAERDAATKLKEADLTIKERDLAQKAAADKELAKARDEIRERERALDKRQEVLSQQDDDLRKQQKMVESNQRRLAERMDDINRRNEELVKILEMQRQSLHSISGLSPGDATKRLLDSLEQERANLGFDPGEVETAQAAVNQARAASQQAQDRYHALRTQLREAELQRDQVIRERDRLKDLAALSDRRQREADEFDLMSREFMEFERYAGERKVPILSDTTSRPISC